MKTIEELRKWQVEAIELGAPAKYALFQAPGGSGKSLVQCALAALDQQMTGNRQLIVVPQNHIHHGFSDEEAVVFPWQNAVTKWKVDRNLCSKRCSDTVAQLRDFLLNAPPGTTAISTHWALVSAWSKLSQQEKAAALKHTSYRIDEAHHISNVFHEDDLDLFNHKDRDVIVEDATRLGRFVRHLLKSGEPTTKLHLTTATFFRGDRKTILSDAFKQSFVHYYLPWDQYYETLGIERLEFDFIAYRKSPIELVLKAIAEEPNERHLVIVPALTRKYRESRTLKRLLDGLYKVYSAEKVLDLVTPDTQADHKDLLFRCPEKFNAVVACRLFDEGTDWVLCNRLHNTDAGEHSLTLAVQRFFRPLRRHPAKKHVRIDNYIPEFSAEMELEEQRRVLSNRFNAMLTCIITQGEIMPTLVKLRASDGSTQKTRLQDIYGSKYRPLLESLLKEFEVCEAKGDSQEVEAVVEKVMEAYGVPEGADRDDVKTALLTYIVRVTTPKAKTSERKSLEVKGLDAEEIRQKGFDRIWRRDAKGALSWGTENISVSTVRELLGIVKQVPTLDQIQRAIQQFHARTGKRLTHSQWVEELGISAHYLDYVCRKRHGTSLNEQVNRVLGDPNENLREKTRAVLLAYAEKGIRLTQESGVIPELKMKANALSCRLQRQYGISLAQLADEVLGVRRKRVTLTMLRFIVRKYLKNGVRLDKASGFISELGMSASDLPKHIMADLNMSLTEIVDGAVRTLKYGNRTWDIPSLEEIHTAIRQHYRKYQERPTRRTAHRLCGKATPSLDSICRTHYSTSLAKEVERVLGKAKNWDELRERTRKVIRKYRGQGIRLLKTYGFLPEMGCTALSLDSQLRYHSRTSLAREVRDVWDS